MLGRRKLTRPEPDVQRERLEAAFMDACASVAETKARYERATETATDSELYRMHRQLPKDLAPIYLYIDGVLDDYLELRNAGLQ